MTDTCGVAVVTMRKRVKELSGVIDYNKPALVRTNVEFNPSK